MAGALGGVGGRGIDHEEADQARRMARDRDRNRLLVARNTRDKRRAPHAASVELHDPAIGQRFG